MLTRLRVRNFKRLDDLDVELGQNVVLIGPNNSGKTSALQALSLWQSGLREWMAQRGDVGRGDRTGATLSRLSLTHTPVSDARLLWRDMKSGPAKSNGGVDALSVLVDGRSDTESWRCGFEYTYANPESFYCRPMRAGAGSQQRLPVPEQAFGMPVAAMPPMSGMMSEEPELQPGRINVLVGEGQTAQVLRNLCFRVYEADVADWHRVREEVRKRFGVALDAPARDQARGTIRLTYAEGENRLDISSAGRGLQQTLLLLAHLYMNRGSVLLFDEPDAHLEILRQREIYTMITETARALASQVIVASHSEIILNEAAEKDVVIAFVGRPHRINDRGSQVVKALRDIGFDQYYLAEIKGAVLYLEGSTDLTMLQAFAARLGHRAVPVLRDPFVHYVGDKPSRAEAHFHGLREAAPSLAGFALFDRSARLPRGSSLPLYRWKRCEIENYVCSKDVLLAFAHGSDIDHPDRARRASAMVEAIAAFETAFRTLRPEDPWGPDVRASKDVLPTVFRIFGEKLGNKNVISKSDFHDLVDFIEPDRIDAEILQVLDLIAEFAGVASAG